MKVSYTWLQSHIVEPLPTSEKIADVFTFHAFEIESVEKTATDTIFDLKVLPDRAADCLSHYGIARELAGLLDLTLKESAKDDQTFPGNPSFVEVQTPRCPRYVAIKIEGITMAQTPDWIRLRLEAIGQQSINAVVDIANYVLFDVGQPIHIFDADKVDGMLSVRPAKAGEKIITLSNEEKILPEGTVVIADLFGVLAIAGIKGGKVAAVTSETKNIIIEIANFDAVTIRKTARALGLNTDAAKRFENNVPLNAIDQAIVEVLPLLADVAGGSVVWRTDTKHAELSERTISFTAAQVTDFLGAEITSEDIESMFSQYRYIFSKDKDTFTLTVPWWRPDLESIANIVDEIGRFRGYSGIEPRTLPSLPPPEENETFTLITKAKLWLAKEGYREVQTYTFVTKGEVEIAYGIKGKNFLRSNLSDGLKDSFEFNAKNTPLLGLSTLKLFEIGTVFFSDREEVHVATADGSVFQEMTLQAFVAAHPEIASVAFESFLPFPQQPALFSVWSPYPFVVRDIAVWITGDENKMVLETMVKEFAQKHCVRPPVLFDTFVKEGRTSMAYRFVFQARDKTLTTEAVEKIIAVLIDEIAQNPSFEIR